MWTKFNKHSSFFHWHKSLISRNPSIQYHTASIERTLDRSRLLSKRVPSNRIASIDPSTTRHFSTSAIFYRAQTYSNRESGYADRRARNLQYPEELSPLQTLARLHRKEWDDSMLKEHLAQFQRNGNIRKQCGEVGIPPSVFKLAVQDFVKAVENGDLPKCGNEVLENAYEESGVVRVRKLLLSSFLEYAQLNMSKYMSEEQIQTFSSLRQISDLRFPADWYAKARQMNRKVILHVGPTNSGKTYNALRRLESAENGIYCGPLRLLAHEIYERMNAKGIPCNLVTGEERREISGQVRLVSSTVEMANMKKTLDVAVIDEIQMIGDPERGWAWTQALLGLQAHEIHLCGDPSVIPLVKELCENVNDELEIKEYKRLSPLITSNKSLYNEFRHIRPGDAVVTFSRYQIFAVKRMIEKATGLQCAVVYGGLPPETRSQQAKLFNDPNSGYDVIVASDAIGMGLNLNVKRIVFETVKKFDGKSHRYLTPSQIKQIAGRAGRFGTAHEVGEVTAMEDGDLRYVTKALNAAVTHIDVAGLQPNAEMVELFAHQLSENVSFSQLLQKFEDLAQVDGQYFLCNFRDLKIIADQIQPVEMSIADRYAFVTSPVNTSDVLVMAYLTKFAQMYGKKEPCHLESLVRLPEQAPTTPEVLKELESAHRVIMLYLWLSYRFPDVFVSVENAIETKARCESLIHESLQTIQFSRKRTKFSRSKTRHMEDIALQSSSDYGNAKRKGFNGAERRERRRRNDDQQLYTA
ncbi:7819_t:CDS:10 [Paraglomus brasilianum]|uniref:RNA helicase n=1 Tax=Paraglomus brasilianum TaxID=144538 RepID=A0A9N8ZZ96_9GLOM|nr:7819_t:CDS:10 [Paraglomus brasilianum]